ncbi:hypothetical protein ACFLUD_01925 [Chloroflexota bacterium]
MSKKLSKQEQETIIVYNRADDTANIFTYDKALQRHLENNLGVKPEGDNGFHGRDYILPKSYIPRPRKPKKLTDEARAKLAERARFMAFKLHAERKSLVNANT